MFATDHHPSNELTSTALVIILERERGRERGRGREIGRERGREGGREGEREGDREEGRAREIDREILYMTVSTQAMLPEGQQLVFQDVV